MSLFTRMAEGAGIGGVLGTAIGALVGGAATTVEVAITAPVSIPAMFATEAVAVGTTLTATEFIWRGNRYCNRRWSRSYGRCSR